MNWGKEKTKMESEEGEAHTCSAAPAAEAELQSSSDPARPSAHHPLPQPAALYQSWRNIMRLKTLQILPHYTENESQVCYI